jgi:hypothetical protein
LAATGRTRLTQADQRMLGRLTESGGDQQATDLVAVQRDGV